MITKNLITTILGVLMNLIDVLSIILPVLLAVALMTIIERKQLAAHQRRVGPNTVGYLGILYTLALSSLGVYGVLLAGWSANSKYAFLGSLRSTAAMISYELILSSAVLIIILITGSLNLTTIIESQQAIWFIIPLFPVFLFYFIAILAETSRTPFDLQEAESELVAGFFTEHSSVPFVFFFLGEYSSIVLFSCITAIFFLGGYNIPELFLNDSIINLQSIFLGFKTCIFCFFFVWFRATLPRLRYDQLINLCWLNLLPVAVAFIIIVPSLLVALDIAPY